MQQNLIDSSARTLVAKLEPWAVHSDLVERDDESQRLPFDASLYRMAAFVAGLVSVAITSVTAL